MILRLLPVLLFACSPKPDARTDSSSPATSDTDFDPVDTETDSETTETDSEITETDTESTETDSEITDSETDTQIDTEALSGTVPDPPIGPPPDFDGVLGMDAKPRSLDDLLGHPTVVWFYPAAASAG